jgi:hypothetical protein
MKASRHIASLVAGLGLMLALPAAVQARAPVPGGGTQPATSAPADKVQTGTVTSIDAARGIIVVDGRSYRMDARHTSLSVDRPKLRGTGLGSIKAGDKVMVRGVEKNGATQAVQVVVTN